MSETIAAKPFCSVNIATSLDGFIARPDGAIDWLAIAEREGEDYGFAEFFLSVDTMIIGRKTWQTLLGFPEWPYYGKRVVVMSSEAYAGTHGEIFHAGPPAVVIEALRLDGAKQVYIDGGTTIRSCVAAGVVGVRTGAGFPVVVGPGVRLFGEGVPLAPLALA
jgi:dihydrofolate reductase